MSAVRIKLNVGGTVFETTQSTIEKLNSSYFNRLLDPKSGFKQPGDNVYFIDRDPECFRVILNIARYGEVFLQNSPITPEILAREADFYLLGSEAIASILRYSQAQQQKEDNITSILQSILHVSQESLRELQHVTHATQELVRGMASQTYWTS